LEKAEEVSIHLFFSGRAHSVRRALVDFELGALNELYGLQCGCLDRNDLIVIVGFSPFSWPQREALPR
jgi:hypothetical protein